MKIINPSNTIKSLAFACALLLQGFVTTAQAEDRALIIGVGEYQISSANLPGIDLDVSMMRNVANLIGFEDSQIKVLENEQATLANVRSTIKSWLINGTSSDDRVLIYYSGHGTRIPDEDGDELDDGSDEVLTMHDLKKIQRNGKNTLGGVLVDDEFGRLIKQIPSNNVFVMIDACHSGTATRGIKLDSLEMGVDTAYEKYYSYKGMPSGSLRRGFIPMEKSGNVNYVALSAAMDDEKSLATGRGSVFTQGIKQTVSNANASKEALTTNQLQAKVDSYIAQTVPGSKRFHPQLNGSKSLANQKLMVSYIDDGYGPDWRNIQNIISKLQPLAVRYNGTTYREGRNMEMEIDIPQRGYLNIVNIQPDDVAIVMFPNRFHSSNLVEAGTIKIPGAKGFELPAGAPYGENLIAIFLSDKPMNLFNDGDGKRDKLGNMMDYFPSLSEYSMRGFQPQATRPQSTEANINDLMGSMKIVEIVPQ